MPTWQTISAREREAVIQYIKTFSSRWQRESVEPAISVPQEPPVTQASIENGKAIFHGKAICFMCHGAEGKGDGFMAAGLKDVWGNPVRPANFTLPAGAHGGVKLGHDSEHIFKTIMTGVGGTPMPPFQAQLKAEEVWDVVHYVQSLRVEAHLADLDAVGLKPTDKSEAQMKIWAALSNASRRGGSNIDKNGVPRASLLQVTVSTSGR